MQLGTYKRVPAADKDVESSTPEPATPSHKQQASSSSSSSSIPQWVLVVVLCCVVSNICSIDRTAMSVAILPMAHQYGWPDSVKGAVNGAFNIGYMVTNLVGGYLAAAYGPKRTLGYGVVLWSLFTLGTPAAASTSVLWVLLVVRAVMGLGEGVAFPCLQVLLKMWVPPDKRTRALGLVYSGHQIGNILSLLLSPPIILRLGWHWVFYLYGTLGFLWMAAWQPLVPPLPPAPLTPTPSASSVELAYVTGPSGGQVEGCGALVGDPAGGSPPSSHGGSSSSSSGGHTHRLDKAPLSGADLGKLPSWRNLPWSSFAKSPAVWALVVAHCSFGITYNMAMAWLPSYYNSAFGVDLKQSAMLSVLPFSVMAVTTNASGWIADALMNRKVFSTSKTRKLLHLVGTGTPAVCLGYLATSSGKGTVSEALLLLTVMLGGLGLQAGGFASTHQDICTKYAGVLFGLTNACSSLAGSLSIYATGLILDWTHSWGRVFGGVMACNVCSLVVFLALGTSEPLFD